MNLELRGITPIGRFEFRWPEGIESFDHGWEAILVIDGRQRRLRHGVGNRHVYGRDRVHTVTWLDGQPTVEGVEADDHARSRALLSRIKRADAKLARTLVEVPPGHEGFLIVTHRDEIDAPYSPHGLAVKIHADDLESWARFALIRAELREPSRPVLSHPRPSPPTSTPGTSPLPTFEPLSLERRRAVAQALIRYEEETNGPLQRGIGKLSANPTADRLVHEDPFAFLLAVLFDQGVQFGRAWSAPLELRRRLGYLDPHRMLAEREALTEAIRRPPALHRFVNKLPNWTLDACRRLIEEYGGRAEAVWGDHPTARELQARLDAFLGISQKKAAMAVMLLWRDCDVEIREMDGCDIAVDIHVRRVFLRSGIVPRDHPRDMIESARELWPDLPGALDPPAWTVGRGWCHANAPACPDCPLADACPKLLERAASVIVP